MIQYNFSYNNPHRHFIDIEISVEVNNEKELFFQLPAWRPGRYELANFSKNIQKWNAFNEHGEKLFSRKVNRNKWCVKTNNSKKVIVKYNYFSNILDAGSTYLDEKQLYVNPINCCFYIIDRVEEEHHLTLNIPKNYKIACSLKKKSNNILIANSFDELVESPFICSNDIKHDKYEVQGTLFHLWFQGDCNPPFKKIKKNFLAFTEEQINCFGNFPEKEYHFLFQITPYKSYHGVEHTKSTVILLGSERDVFENRYDDLLGISSHELYHTWNIKSIKPVEMYKYDYTKENYSKLGYVTEGATTYFGDLMLYRSGVFNWTQFINTQNENLKRHLENHGRYNLSVSDSSFDTWIDGYQLGIPNRKTSIYTEGALCMFMLDVLIIINSNAKFSLNNVMKDLYVQYALKNKGYTEKDFISLCVKYGGDDVLDIFKKHIHGFEDYISTFENILPKIGLEIIDKDNPSITASLFGFFLVKRNNKYIVSKVLLNSVSDKAGIAVEDELVEINKSKNINNLKSIISDSTEVKLTFKRLFDTKEFNLKKSKYYILKEIKKINTNDPKINLLRNFWLNK